MTITTGSRVGQYQLEGRLPSTESGERFTASETGLDRPVSVIVTSLPDDPAAADALRERARRLAALADTRLLPVYGQGEDGGVLWLALRQLNDNTLSRIDKLDPARAARLGEQLAEQLAALRDAGLAPATLTADDIVIEGEGSNERAWIVLEPARPISESADGATEALLGLLAVRAGRPLLSQTLTDPAELAAALSERSAGGNRRKWVLLAVGCLVVAGLAAGLGVAFTGDSSKPETADAGAPVARTVARIPIGVALGDPGSNRLVANDNNVWAMTQDGVLVHVDPNGNRVVGAPIHLFGKGSYPGLAIAGNTLWAASTELVRIDARTGKVTGRAPVAGKQSELFTLAATPSTVWATLSVAYNFAESVVRYDARTLKELSRSKTFGSVPVLVAPTERSVWASNTEDGTFSRVTSNGGISTIGAAVGGQLGYASSTGRRIWVPTRVDGSLLGIDPKTMTIETVAHFPAQPVAAVTGRGSLWVLTQQPSRIYRVDPASARILGAPVPAPTGAGFFAYGRGSLWVDDPKAKSLIRMTSTSPPPAAATAVANARVLTSGPVPVGKRLLVPVFRPRFSIDAPDPSWIAGNANANGLEIGNVSPPLTGIDALTATAVFEPSGRITQVRTPDDFLAALRRNPALTVSKAETIKVDGVSGLRVTVTAHPKPPYPQLCRGHGCVPILPSPAATLVLYDGSKNELSLVPRGPKLLLFAAEFGKHPTPALVARSRRLVDSIRFLR